jgi:Kazal-type serine protease inhibitor domain
MKKLKLFCFVLPLSIFSCTKNCQENISEICQEKINPNVVCTEQYDPVCGCNNKTYGNACLAGAAGITIISKGECKK